MGTRQVKGVRGRYEAGKRGVRQVKEVRGRKNGCETITREVKRGARQVQGR